MSKRARQARETPRVSKTSLRFDPRCDSITRPLQGIYDVRCLLDAGHHGRHQHRETTWVNVRS